MERNDFYVYAILDPRKPGKYRYGKYKFDHEPIYIGKGRGSRIKHHLQPHGLKAKTHKARKLNSIINSGKKPILVKVREDLTERKAFRAEAKAIASIGRGKNGPLTNLTDGGEGSSGAVKSLKSRKKNAESCKRYRQGAAPEDLNRWFSNIAKGHAARTPEQRAEYALRQSEIQTNLDPVVDKRRRRKLRKALLAYRACQTDAERQAIAQTLSDATQAYWDSVSDEEREWRTACIQRGVDARSEEVEEARKKNIAEAIKRQHAERDPVESMARRTMLSASNLIKRYAADRGWSQTTVKQIKADIRARAVRYYAKGKERSPRELLPKIEKVLMTYT